jgi:cytochrome c oxidase subunit 3
MANTTKAAAAAVHADEHAHHGKTWLQHHYDTPVQQFEAAKLGMWLFLAQEVLFFSGLFVAYGVFRVNYPEAWEAGSAQLDRIIGGFNTCVLLISSFTAAMAVRSAQLGDRKWTSYNLLITMVCAGAFLVIKYFEYKAKVDHGLLPGDIQAGGFSSILAEYGVYFHPDLHHIHPWRDDMTHVTAMPAMTHVFFGIYFVLTGLHGVHVAVGIGVIAWVWIRNQRGEFNKDYWTPVDIVALYWHLVDLVWIYLFPLLYLI